MSEHVLSRTAGRRGLAALLALVSVALLAGCGSAANTASTTAPESESSAHTSGAPPGAIPIDETLQGGRRDAVGAADGSLPDGVTVLDDELPGIARLDPALRGALRAATDDAAQAGLTISVASGWRSARYQEQLFEQAVSKYGSEEAAARWVARPGTSAHETGQAVDVGPARAAAWLAENGSAYGLCQIYLNEPWHFEWRSEAVDHGCPAAYADPAAVSGER